jgi:hypothetical protein
MHARMQVHLRLDSLMHGDARVIMVVWAMRCVRVHELHMHVQMRRTCMAQVRWKACA